MKATSLVLTTRIAAALEEASRVQLETAAVVLASIVEIGEVTRILARELRWVPEEAYDVRAPARLSIKSTGYVPALGEAERLGCAAIFLHTHPIAGMEPVPSPYDEIVDGELADLFRLRSGSPFYGSVVVSPIDEGIAFTGKLAREGEPAVAIDRTWIVGDRFRMVPAFGTPNPAVSA